MQDYSRKTWNSKMQWQVYMVVGQFVLILPWNRDKKILIAFEQSFCMGDYVAILLQANWQFVRAHGHSRPLAQVLLFKGFCLLLPVWCIAFLDGFPLPLLKP